MKYVIIAVIVLAVFGGGIAFTNRTVTVENNVPKIVEKEVTVEVNPLDEQIKAREAELEQRYDDIKKVEAERDVLIADVEQKQARIKELNKTLAGFMIATTSKR